MKKSSTQHYNRSDRISHQKKSSNSPRVLAFILHAWSYSEVSVSSSSVSFLYVPKRFHERSSPLDATPGNHFQALASVSLHADASTTRSKQ